MRNLNITRDSCGHFDVGPTECAGSSAYLAADAASDTVMVLDSQGVVSCLDSDECLLWHANVAEADGVSSAPGGWFTCEYVVELSSLCCVHHDGTLVLVHTPENVRSSLSESRTGSVRLGPESMELIGTFDGGLCAAAWSFDQSRLALVTGLHRLLVLTSSWDVMAEVQVDAFVLPRALEATSEAKTVTLHAARDCDPNAVCLSWRPDGLLLSLSTVSVDVVGRRIVRIYSSQDASLSATGKNEDGSDAICLQASLGWSGDNQLIGAGQCVLPRSRLQIAFFESNGLRHRELVLAGHTPATSRVVRLAWNSDSDILAVELESAIDCPNGACQALTLWHRDNYHWYCKAEWRYGRSGSGSATGNSSVHGEVLSGWSWDRQRPHRLYLCVQGCSATEGPRIHTLDLSWCYCADEGGAAGLVATTDEAGGLRLTALAVAQVPPPVSYGTLGFRAVDRSTALGASMQANTLPTPFGGCQPICTAWQPKGTHLGVDGSAHAGLACLTSGGFLILLPVHVLPPPLANRDTAPGTRNGVHAGEGVGVLPSHKEDAGEINLTGSKPGCPALPLAVNLAGVTCVVHDEDAVLELRPSLLRLLTWAHQENRGEKTSALFIAVLPSGAYQSNAVHRGQRGLGGDLLVALHVTWSGEVSGVGGRVTAIAVRVPSEASSVSLAASRVAGIAVPCRLGVLQGFGPQIGSTAAVVHTWSGHAYALHFQPGSSGGTVLMQRICTLPEPCTRILALVPPRHVLEQVQAQYELRTGSGPVPVPHLLCVGIGARTGRLYCHGGGIVSLSSGSMGMHADHGLLLQVSTGPTPSMTYTHVSDLLRVSVGLDPSTAMGAGDGYGAYGTHPLAAAMMSQGGATLPAALLGSGVPLYAGAAAWNSSTRALERGARLVLCVPDADQVVVQAPRGNIESVVPRALSVARLRALLDARPVPAWGVALELARKHRIDLNLLYDHNEPAFMHEEWLRAAVGQVAAVVAAGSVGTASASVARKARAGAGHDRWDLLLSDLNETDTVTGRVEGGLGGEFVSRSHLGEDEDGEGGGISAGLPAAKYPRQSWYTPPDGPPLGLSSAAEWLPRLQEQALLHGASKVNRVTSHVRSALLFNMALSHPSIRDLSAEEASTAVRPSHIVWQHPLALSVITSYARQSPADLESVLRVVQQIAQAEGRNTGKGLAAVLPPPTLQPLTGDAALAHAILVCDSDVELLYTAGLGCYDLLLAHAVSQRSGGMDPRETVPFLAGLTRVGQAKNGEPAAVQAVPTPAEHETAVNDRGWTFPESSFALSALPTVSERGLLDFGPRLGKLLPGQVRQRFAIDVHLGRWQRALEWLASMAYVQVTSGAADVDETSLMTSLCTALPADADSVVSAGVARPLPTLLSMVYTHGLHDHVGGLRTAVSSALDPSRPAIDSKMVANWGRVVVAVAVARGWWMLAGRWKPARAGSASIAGGPPPRGTTGALFSNLCLSPYLGVAAAKPTADDCREAVAALLSAPDTPTEAVRAAFAICAVHAGVTLGAPLSTCEVLSLGLRELRRVRAIQAHGDPHGNGHNDMDESETGEMGQEDEDCLFAHAALVLAERMGVGKIADTAEAAVAKPIPSPDGEQAPSSKASPASRRGARAGRVDLSALAAGTLYVPSMVEIEEETLLKEEMSDAHASLSLINSIALSSIPEPETRLCGIAFTWQGVVAEVWRSLGNESGHTQKVAAARMQLTYSPALDADDAIMALCDARLWSEAANRSRSASVNRSDLVETVVVSSLKEAASASVDDIASRQEATLTALASLTACRLLRSSMSLHELLGHDTAEALLHAANGGDAQGDVEGWKDSASAAGGGGGSVFSDASSVVSASWMSGRGSSVASAASAGSAGGSVLSALSQRSSKTAGVFSHWTRQNVTQSLVDPRHSLRTGTEEEGSQIGFAGAEAGITVAGLRQLDRQRKRQEAKRQPGKALPGGGGSSGKLRGAGRFRPGSDAEQTHWENEVAASLPKPAFAVDMKRMRDTLLAFGLREEARSIDAAVAALEYAVQNAPRPLPRRDGRAEIVAAVRQQQPLGDAPACELVTTGEGAAFSDPVDLLAGFTLSL